MVRTVGEDKSEQKVIDDIAEYGWHCVHVIAEGELVEYSFTVGLFKSYGHPELIIFGLPSKVSHQILAIAVEAAQAGSPLDLTQPSDALLKNFLSRSTTSTLATPAGTTRAMAFRCTKLFGLLGRVFSRGIIKLPRVSCHPASNRTAPGWHLTIHSSRSRFAARLNSGVRPLCKSLESR
jgi:hypothetical protein